MPETVLITTHDLEPAVRLKDAFRAEGYRVELLTATERIADVPDPALLVVTGGLDEKRARRLLREAAELDRLPAIGLADSPAQAIPEARRRLGLAECFVKPADPGEVALVGRRIIERRRLQALTGIIGESAAIQEALERVVQIAPVHSTVLITGESGTGKELVARGIHALSPRAARPFIAANVAALPETLLESELFGHEKGAFTGAVAQRKGLFELADRGTLFLDEIGEMPLATQTKLLRALEEREFLRVGGELPIRVDVRVIAATNRDLREAVELGEFRRDLYYRLNVLRIELPPLRERRDDIPLLVEAFMRRTTREHDLPHVALAPEALALLMRYDWPGNIRELRNLVESMAVLSPGQVIRPDDIPPEVRNGTGRGALLPIPVPRPPRNDGEGTAPQLEFIFRTLLQLRMDVEDLRREFDAFRQANPEFPGPVQLPYPYPLVPAGRITAPAGVEVSRVVDEPAPPAEDDDDDEPEGIVVFRPGKKMSDLEREAIIAALREVGGNRRKAAKMLGIGERTLYRKLKEYDIAV
ncbi:MAG TPA: sigma-54 dependent transcriptional regulator [Longimicrobiales bacterium]